MLKNDPSEDESRLNFLDFIEAARKGEREPEPGLEKSYNDKRMEQGVKPRDLLTFFQDAGFGDITLDDCKIMMRIAQGRVDFHQQLSRY